MAVPFGRYQLLRRLGRGGMGEVFLAERRVGGVEKRLVIKRIHRARAADPRFLAMFMREAQLSMALAHQNIVTVFDFGRVQGDVFLAMEHVEGVDLATALAASPERSVPPLVAAFVAAECCRALDHAHRRKDPSGAALGIVHRDVSPRNLLLSDAGEVKLADFGIAAVAGDGDGKTRGTPAYMAPEQARGEPVDARSDLYALGLVLWEAASGKRARQGEVLALAQSGELPAIDDALPAPLRDVIARATQRDPAARYADAREMGADLERYVVTERAKEHGPAPDTLLADWLASTGANRSTGEALDGVGELAVVTFADDGADAVGATQRSGAETIDGPPVEEAPPPREEPRGPRRSRGAWVMVAVAGVALVGSLAFTLWPGSTSSTTTEAPTPPAAPENPGMNIHSDITPIYVEKPVIGMNVHSDTSKPPKPVESKPVESKPVEPKPVEPKRLEPKPIETKPQRVTIGAKPWATFTIDGDATVHQTPDTVQLATGAHVVHFTNPTLKVTRDVPLQVGEAEVRYVEDLSR